MGADGHGGQYILSTRARTGLVIRVHRSSLTPGPPATVGAMDDHPKVRGFVHGAVAAPIPEGRLAADLDRLAPIGKPWNRPAPMFAAPTATSSRLASTS